MNEFRLNRRVQLGTIIGGVQSDGGQLQNSWEYWRARGFIKGGAGPEGAPGHWTHWREDLDIMQRMGLTSCRYCLDWARIEPKEGEFDEEAIGHVAQEIYQLRVTGICSILTLHRFSDPVWFLKKGGWEKKENMLSFLKYTEKMLRTLGHLVNEYLPLDEPNLYAINGYYKGVWPPGKKSVPTTLQVMSVMAATHIRCYKLIHSVRRELGFDDTRVGCSVHMRELEPKNPKSPAGRLRANFINQSYQTAIAEAMAAGRFHHGIKNLALAREGQYADFIGLGYYTRAYVTGKGQSMRDGVAKSDLGWEIWPEGLVNCAKKLGSLCPVPIFVTANGVCDNSDAFRCRFLYDHLRAMSEADVTIERYYYRSLLDGFEWLEGEGARFGLVEADPEQGKRRMKKSGEFFSKIISHCGVTQEMYEKYVADERYVLK